MIKDESYWLKKRQLRESKRHYKMNKRSIDRESKERFVRIRLVDGKPVFIDKYGNQTDRHPRED